MSTKTRKNTRQSRAQQPRKGLKNGGTPPKRLDGGSKLTPTQQLSWNLKNRGKSTNIRNNRRRQKQNKNGEKTKTLDEIPYNRPNGIAGVTKVDYGLKEKFLNPSQYTIITPKMPAVQTIDINVPVYQKALTKAAAVSSFIAMAMGIAVDETITLQDGSVVGTIWFYTATIAYDLYQAMAGSYSLFDSAPKWYWDLRCAVAPASRGGFAYNFYVPDTFFGLDGLYPSGFPLVVDDENSNTLGWKTGNTGGQDSLQVAIPPITVLDFADNGSYVANAIWTSMSNLSESTKIIPNPYGENPYTKSVAAFMAYVPENALDTTNDRWSTFSSEVLINQWEEWVAFLGLAEFNVGIDTEGINFTRTGKHCMKEYQYADYLGDRIVCGKYGKVPTEYIRKKQISLEWIAGNIITQLVGADAFYNSKAGTNSINNVGWDMSVLYNLPISYINMALMAVLRRWQLLNAAYFDNPDSLAYSLTGRKFYVGASGVIEMTSRMIKEFLADMGPICQTSTIGSFKTVPVIVAYGNFAMDPTNNGDGTVPFYDLTHLVNMMYQTATPAISYTTQMNYQGLLAYIDITNTAIADFTGPQVPIAEQAITDAFAVLQGNLDCGAASANNNESTLAYYTLLLNFSTITSLERFEKKKKFVSQKKTDVQAPILAWTILYGATFNQLNNKYTFTSDLVSYDLSRGLCVSFQQPPFHAAVFKETNYLLYSQDELVLFASNVVNGAKLFIHPIATNGGFEANEMIQTFTTQNIGGGFGGLAKGLLSKIPIVGELLGGLAEGLLGD
jgi:hypothetical protein